MNYDLAVWVGDRPADDGAALKVFEELWQRYEGTDEPPHPKLLAFIDELTKRYPDLDELDNEHVDESPWAVGSMINEVMGPFLYFAMTYPGAREIYGFVTETARRHGLVCFDPQTSTLV